MVVERFGHIASLAGSMFISIIPILLFCFMPETLGDREHHKANQLRQQQQEQHSTADAADYKSMPDIV